MDIKHFRPIGPDRMRSGESVIIYDLREDCKLRLGWKLIRPMQSAHYAFARSSIRPAMFQVTKNRGGSAEAALYMFKYSTGLMNARIMKLHDWRQLPPTIYVPRSQELMMAILRGVL